MASSFAEGGYCGSALQFCRRGWSCVIALSLWLYRITTLSSSSPGVCSRALHIIAREVSLRSADVPSSICVIRCGCMPVNFASMYFVMPRATLASAIARPSRVGSVVLSVIHHYMALCSVNLNDEYFCSKKNNHKFYNHVILLLKNNNEVSGKTALMNIRLSMYLFYMHNMYFPYSVHQAASRNSGMFRVFFPRRKMPDMVRRQYINDVLYFSGGRPLGQFQRPRPCEGCIIRVSSLAWLRHFPCQDEIHQVSRQIPLEEETVEWGIFRIRPAVSEKTLSRNGSERLRDATDNVNKSRENGLPYRGKLMGNPALF